MEQIGNERVFRLRKKEKEMGVEMLEIGVQIRKFFVICIKTCYRSVLNHPFLVGMVLFFFFMYRSFPFLFSLFVSASPVLVCTAVLLGTLLSFGQPNIPEIEKEEDVVHEIAPLKTGIHRDSIVVERDESFVVERHTTKRSDVVSDVSIEEANSTADRVTEVEKDDGGLVHSAPLIEENSRKVHFEKPVTEEEGELHHLGFEMKPEVNEEKLEDRVFLENQYSRIEKEVEDENVELSHDRSLEESIVSGTADHADTSPISPWKPAGEEEEGVDDEASDSGSDRAESSSPDASMADIMPMLDELHPLLDEDAPQPAQMSHDGSDAGSERSQKSSDATDESDEESEHHEDEVADDDEEEEETLGAKDDEIKSAIKWTEDDQKNLMDLGTSELERNQRLENLIARRRARRMLTEKNLIDFDSTDLPFNIPPISTARRNPFDLPYDSNDNTELPPIPGSAPSILLPRRNPFDIPYDPSEEKPDLKGDGFQQEFMPFAPKETFFRRHESFNVGPSLFGPPKHDKQDIKFNPYFVAERVISEGASHSSFQRQSSELSDSKVSSIPETESVCSAGDQDDKKIIEEDLSQDADLLLDVEHLTEHVGHGSESSEDVATVELGQAEQRVIEHDEVEIDLGDVESHSEIISSFSETRDIATLGEHDAGDIHLNTRADEVNYSSRSSSSSFSEGHEKIFDEKEDEVSPSLQSAKEDVIESGFSIQSSVVESGVNTRMESVVDSQHKEPVYDSSPPAVHKNLSSSSISSDMQVETSEMGFSPVLVKKMVSFEDTDTEVTDRSIGVDTPKEQILSDSSQVDSVNNNEMLTSGVTEKAEHILFNHEFSGDDKKLDVGSTVPEVVAEHAPITSKPSLDSASEEDHRIYQDGSYQHEQDQGPSSSFDSYIDRAAHQVVIEDMASAASCSEYKSSEDLNLTASKEEQPSVVVFEQVSGSSVASSSEREEHPLDQEVALQIKQDQVHSSSSDESFHVAIDQEPKEELLSTHTECVSEENLVYKLEEHVPMSDKAMIESSSDNHEELKEPSIIHLESITDVNAPSKLDAAEFQAKNEESTDIHSPLTPDSASLPSEVSETRSPTALSDYKYDALDGFENPDQVPVQSFNFPTEATGSQVHEHDIIEEADEIKEIDEGLLMELDAVGDFSVEELGSKSDKIGNNLVTREEMNSEMPFVEARSVEDIDSIFKKMEPVPTKAEVEIGEIPQQSHIKEEVDSGIPVLEARSLEDLDSVFERTKPMPVKEEVEIAEIPQQSHIKEEVDSGMPVLEARSLQDLDSVFERTKPMPVKEEVEIGEIPQQSHIKEQVESGMPVLEARSLEDIDSVFGRTKPMPAKEEVEIAEIPQQSDIKEEVDSGMPVLEALSLEDIDSVLGRTIPMPVKEEVEIAEIPQQSDIEEEVDSGMPVLEAQSLEDIDSVFKKTEPVPVKAEVEIGEVELPQQSQIEEEINLGMPVLEAHSLEDIDTAFSQTSGEEIKMPVVVESVHAELIPEEIKAGRSENEISSKDTSLAETKVEVPVVEARSIEDIDSAMMATTKVELPVVEARTIEDIDLAIKQLQSSSSSSEGRLDIVESRDPADIDPDLHVERQTKPSSLDERLDDLESKNPAESNAELHLSEARSVKDTDVALKLVSPLKSDLKDGSGKRESIEVSSSKEMESSIKEPDGPETSSHVTELPDKGAQTSDDLSLSISDGKSKKKKSGESSSNSSSSSSSSDSE